MSSLVIDTVRKDIKNIHLGVYPPDGRIRVAVPLQTDDEAIRLFLLSKMHWIENQQLKFLQQERQTQREYVSGESHYFLGTRYLLNVITKDDPPQVEIRNKKYIDLYIRPDTSVKKREKIFNEFYRSELSKLIPGLLSKWQEKVGVNISEVKIKKMRTKWGSCIPSKKRIWLNLELAKKPIQCIEYVFVHESIHLIEKNHTPKFIELFGSAMPKWQQYKYELNRQVLGFSDWKKSGTNTSIGIGLDAIIRTCPEEEGNEA